MNNFNDWTDYQNNNINEFAQNYRNALQQQLQAANATTEQTRANAQAGIMSKANTAGMMYSNFPARSKIMYDTSAYYPGLIKNQQAYQQGLDTLRNNMTSYWNKIKDMEDKINLLNYQKYDFAYDFPYDFAYDW